ncbi:hypothetical protein [Streptomyces sp. P17]|uniref:hypothetical protein n=1 Tax=Streptomyces sp. P17 TaxID=3074716 RepID=UPI0028F45540|nr:hypothetical protein [Streptomyces sp. P17]MDT9698581.1 hypothetical protein [Streptomyces sp. P17]
MREYVAEDRTTVRTRPLGPVTAARSIAATGVRWRTPPVSRSRTPSLSRAAERRRPCRTSGDVSISVTRGQ